MRPLSPKNQLIYVKKLVKKKWSQQNSYLVKRDLMESLVVVADTLVFCDEIPLGKPKDKADAKRMLRLLSGRSHEVITSIGCCLRGRIITFMIRRM